MIQPHWSSFYAPGSEILAYLERVVEKYKIMRYIKLRHELVYAQYDETNAKWRLRIRRPVFPSATYGEGEIEYEEFEDTADVVLSGAGGLSRWKWPDIEGLESFKGKLIHSAEWDVGEEGESWQESVKDWGEKRVGVIGVVRHQPIILNINSPLINFRVIRIGIIRAPDSALASATSCFAEELRPG